MGDFNSNYDKFLEKTSRSSQYYWKMDIFKKLQQLDMVETTSLMQDISPSNPQFTFMRGNLKSRIDYIWMDMDLCTSIAKNNTSESFLFSTDHLIVNTMVYPEAITGQIIIAKLKKSSFNSI